MELNIELIKSTFDLHEESLKVLTPEVRADLSERAYQIIKIVRKIDAQAENDGCVVQ